MKNEIYLKQFVDWVVQHKDEWSILCGVSRRVLSDKELQNLFADLNTLSSVNVLFIPLLHIMLGRRAHLMMKNDPHDKEKIICDMMEVVETAVGGTEVRRIYMGE